MGNDEGKKERYNSVLQNIIFIFLNIIFEAIWNWWTDKFTVSVFDIINKWYLNDNGGD